MRFLVIARPASGSYDLTRDPREIRRHAQELREGLEHEVVEGAWALVAGGYAYVLQVRTTEELAVKIRRDPLFAHSRTEVIPISPAVDFLEEMAKVLESGAM